MSRDGWDPGPPPSRVVEFPGVGASDLRKEAEQRISAIEPALALLPVKDYQFVSDVMKKLEDKRWIPTRPQVFWLRDIEERLTRGSDE